MAQLQAGTEANRSYRNGQNRSQTTVKRFSKYIPQTPTERQMIFLGLSCKEAFFGGAARGGKSSALLMAALQYVHVPGYKAILFRKTFRDLALPEALMDRAREWLTGTDAKWDGINHCWRFPSTASLSFGYMDNENDKYRYQSAAFHFIGVDEVPHFSETMYLYLHSRICRPDESTMPTRMRCAGNPDGTGFKWVKKRFIMEREKHGIVFVPAQLEDNPHVDQKDYDERLKKLDVITYKKLRYGDWNDYSMGKIFKREKFKIVKALRANMTWVRFWDMAGTEYVEGENDPDYTAGGLIGVSSDGIIQMADIKRVRKTPYGVEQVVKQTAILDTFTIPIRIEEEGGASGKALIYHYVRVVLNGFDVRGFRPTGSKEIYARPLAAQVEAGNVELLEGEWNSDFLDEADMFDGSGNFHDDQIDCMSKGYYELVKMTRGVTIATGDNLYVDGKIIGAQEPPDPRKNMSDDVPLSEEDENKLIVQDGYSLNEWLGG